MKFHLNRNAVIIPIIAFALAACTTEPQNEKSADVPFEPFVDTSRVIVDTSNASAEGLEDYFYTPGDPSDSTDTNKESTENLFPIDDFLSSSDINGENTENNQSASYLSYEFSALDLYGNVVTERSLGEKEAYFIHFWATWCAPCVHEMPDLAALSKEYEERVGFLGLTDDFSTSSNDAMEIIETAGLPASFLMIDANEPSASALLEMVQTGYVPTTVIIKGDEIHGPFIGAYGDGYKEYLDKLLES